MKLNKYLILMIIATLFSLFSFLIVIYSVDPFNTVFLGFMLFYFSLFFSLVGIFAVFGFLFRYFFNKNQFISEKVLISFRQAILFGILIVSGIYLQSQRLIVWWNLFILILLLSLIEFYFASKNKMYEE